MTKISRKDLLAAKNGNGPVTTAAVEPDPARFVAETLALQVTAPDGTVVYECELAPRGFKPKERRGQMLGGVGWYAEQPEDASGKKTKILGSYRDIPVSANCMLFLDGVKVPPGQLVDLISDDDE